MRPPICAICKKRFNPRSENPSGLVYFQLSQEEKEYNEEMKRKRITGHPKGREWFCEAHYAIAKKYNALFRGEAIALIKNQLDAADQNE